MEVEETLMRSEELHFIDFLVVYFLLGGDDVARKFTVIIEKGEKEYIGRVVELPGCHTQGATIDELMENIKEAIKLYLYLTETIDGGEIEPVEIVDVRTVEV